MTLFYSFLIVIIVLVPTSITQNLSSLFCSQIPMPSQSHFIGLDPPSDQKKWSQAIETVCRGELVLLKRVHERIHKYEDIYETDSSFRWTHRFADLLIHKGSEMEKEIREFPADRAPIVHFGRRNFKSPNFTGPCINTDSFRPDKFIDWKGSFPRKIVAIGAMNENWGWLSTNILNRTVNWLHQFSPAQKGRSDMEVLKNFFDDPNLLFLITNQHNNISHPKVVGMLLGVKAASTIYSLGQRVLNKELPKGVEPKDSTSRKTVLLINGGSDYGARPAIRECVHKKMGPEMETITKKISQTAFFTKILHAVAVLCMPGLGYDTYRLSETLLLGSMPVIERGVGLDRNVYKLPALVVDDFSYVTPELVYSAYVEAVYREEEWEYERLTLPFWKRLMRNASETQSSDIFYHYFPLKSVLTGFIRPLFPFDCEEMGGCGPEVTARMPKTYCAIDTHRDWRTYVYGRFV